MKKELYSCDVCGIEVPENSRKKIQVIFLTDQNEGKAASPYFEINPLDLCHGCNAKALKGNAIYAEGAMGFNKYFFNSK